MDAIKCTYTRELNECEQSCSSSHRLSRRANIRQNCTRNIRYNRDTLAVLELPGEGWGLNPLSSFKRPPSSRKFQPPQGSPQPPSSLLIEYYFVIAVIIYWIGGPTWQWWCLFKIKNLKFCGRGALPIPQWDQEGSPLDIKYTSFSIRPSTAFDSPPPGVFEKFEQFTLDTTHVCAQSITTLYKSHLKLTLTELDTLTKHRCSVRQ